MLLLGITGPIGHGKTSLANAIEEVCGQASRQLSTSELIMEVGTALNKSTTTIPNPDNIDSMNVWLSPLPSIIFSILHTVVSSAQIDIKNDDIEKNPALYTKLFKYIRMIGSQKTLLKQTINESNKEDYRSLLQWLGGYFVAKVDEGIWLNELVRKASSFEGDNIEVCTMQSLRYPKDAEIVRNAGGIIVEIRRPEVAIVDIWDVTEKQRQEIQSNAIIYNTGTLKDLNDCARTMIEDAKKGQLKSEYYTKV